MFVKISNEASEVNRLFLEKLGVSTKRDDDATIGQFGSGAKFAPIAALRNGWRWVNVGSDNRGDYMMEYAVENIDGFDVVVFDYGDGERRESSYTLDAGVLSWEDPFQIFREAFSNALDAKICDGADYSIEIVDEIVHEPGVFSVYLTAAPEIVDIVDNLKNYFLLDREPVAISSNVKAYACTDGIPRVFYKGVLVYEGSTDDGYALYNYEMDNLTLNEERRVRAEYQIQDQLAAFLAFLEDDRVIKKFFDADGETHWELSQVNKWRIQAYSPNDAWPHFWLDKHGDDAIPVLADLWKLSSYVKLNNKKPIKVYNETLEFLITDTGLVQSAVTVAGDEVDFNFVELDAFEQAQFELAKQVAKPVIGDADIVTEWKWFSPSDKQSNVLGIAKMEEYAIYLNKNILWDQTSLIGTIVHEYQHLFHQVDDDDRAFRSCADNTIADLLVRISAMSASVSS